MRLACISDIHGQWRQLPTPNPVDVIVVAGDFLGMGRANELPGFVSWVMQLPAKHKIVIAGNHDKCMEDPVNAMTFGAGITYLQDSGIRIDGVHFYGSPWTPTFGKWAFMKGDDKLGPIWGQIPADTDVLITHGPAQGTLDYVPGGGHVGSATLRAELDGPRISPLVHISGHIHEHGGVVRVDSKMVSANVAALDESYRLRSANPWVYLEVSSNA